MSTPRGGRRKPARHEPTRRNDRAQQGRGGTGGAPSRGGQRSGQEGSSSKRQPKVDVHVPDGIRLQKVLASAGVASRRACEELIADGRVSVDGHVVTELGVRVDPLKQAIEVDGMRIHMDDSKVTVVLNKPWGVVSTMALQDSEGRPTVAEYVYNRSERFFHVGRLDTDSEGLLLLTNDGEMANRLTHPSYEVEKRYLVQVDGRITQAASRKLLAGITLDDGPAALDSYRFIDFDGKESQVEVTLHEGRNRIVRRMFEHVGFPVTRLVRTQFGPIRLDTIRPGSTRVLSNTEVGQLLALVGL
ncbi:pseudouridine synthase [Rarobacter faecitabidus]|uniref:Pseudouridine synthase n=1 Tax=Rarobacter faecitabidus TaxID=13243 RepID=A0A542ZVU2_RARFA|nr:pseudouridine synthase [Rarobacter faecitabidus]TQL64487.1 23S rRNA pseudouridine2605 synthase [Rarobacter faecitabidus]